MSDLVERLRRGPSWDYDGYKAFKLMQEAADAIEERDAEIARLQAKLFRKDERIKAWKQSSDEYEAEVERLSAALSCIENTPPDELPVHDNWSWWHRLVNEMRKQAREALNHESD